MLLALTHQDLLRLNYGNASILEILWSLGALIGLVVTGMNAVNAYRDLRALQCREDYLANGPRHIVAKRNIRNQSARFAMLLSMLFTGCVGMATPPAPSLQHHDMPTFYGLAIAGMLLFIEVMITLSSIYDYRNRQALLDALDRERTAHTADMQRSED